jgi:hypothetical protein
VDYPVSGGATVVWWGKIDRKLDSGRDQIFLSLFKNGESGFLPEVGGEKRTLDSMVFGVRPSGQFFVEEVTPSTAAATGVYRELVSLPSALVGLEWHHWAVTFDFPAGDLTKREIRVYRDAVLVHEQSFPVPLDAMGDAVSTSDPSYKPGILEGVYNRTGFAWSSYRTPAPADVFKNESFEGGLNNITITSSAASQSAILTHANSSGSSLGGHTNRSNEGLPVFTGNVPIDGVTREDFPDAAREFLRINKGPITLGDTGNRLVTETVTISDWLRVKWQWKGQVRYRFDAAGDVADGSTLFAGQSFIRVYQDDPATTGVDESINGQVIPGLAPFNEHWIDLDTRVEMGAFYRTFDRCQTMTDFPAAPSGDAGGLGTNISDLKDTTLNDFMGRPRTARIWNIPAAVAPTEIHWVYQPTVFRATIPLGLSFDPTTPNTYLVPHLCEDGKLSMAGPSEQFLLPLGVPPEGPRTGNPVRWDKVGKKLFPVHPGSNMIEWPDQDDPGTKYRIEIVSDYPDERGVPLSSELEELSGLRETTTTPNGNPVYVNAAGVPMAPPGGGVPLFYKTTVNLAAVGADFPASPSAHYNHLFEPVQGRRPPTKLDLDTTDEWAFQELAYTDVITDASVDGGAAGKSFQPVGTGRSVLLYSVRPNANEVADGNLTKEQLVVRVIDSVVRTPLLPNDPKLVLGRRGLELGGNRQGVDQRSDGAFGVILRESPDRTINPGTNFVIDYWLNGKGLRADDEPVTILATGDDNLTVTLDAESSTITANYHGIAVTHPFTTGGATWKHHVIHAFTDEFFGIEMTFLNFYVDGLRREQGAVMSSTSPILSQVDPGLSDASLRLGGGADPRSQLQLDELRIYDLTERDNPWLTGQELLDLQTSGTAQVDGTDALLRFSFEEEPTEGSFQASGGNYLNVGIGPVDLDLAVPFAGAWARVDIQEVATRLDSPLDQAGFGGSGYVLNSISNYNAELYTRDAEVGGWGPIFPVNHGQLYTSANARLEVAYYQNLFLLDQKKHPNVAWPYQSAAYNEVIFPTYGPHRDKAIYIASRVGSEGVDAKGRTQTIFDLANFSDLKIYNQPDTRLAGWNLNEEHALVAPSNRAALKMKNLGDDIPNNPPLAAFALQRDINASIATFTSEPWVLVQVSNLETGEPEMAAYQVLKTRPGGRIHFPRPSDALVNSTAGLAYESAANPEERFLTIDPNEIHDFAYGFSYPVAAGDLLIPPYPLNLVIGNVAMADARGGNHLTQRTLWRDDYGHPWVVSGNGRFFYQYFYPFRGDFFLPNTAPGTPVAWVPNVMNGTHSFTGLGDSLEPAEVVYHSFWRTSYPKLKRGETLTYQGGESFSENPGSNGLPALVAMSAAEIVYDVATPTMIIGDNNVDDYSARIIRPLDRHEAPFTVAQMAAAGFSPAGSSLFVVAERWYFEDLPGSLQRRFYFDSLAEKLVFRGFLNDKDSGDPDLTSGPDPINTLEPNVITADDLARLLPLGTTEDWSKAITAIHNRSQNPTLIREEAPPANPAVTGDYLAGMKESPVATERIGLNTDLYGENGNLAAERDRIKRLARELSRLERRWDVQIASQFNIDVGQAALRSSIDSSLVDYVGIAAKVSKLGYNISELPTPEESRYVHLDSFGVGSALVSNPKLLTSPVEGSRYITIAENNRSELDGAPVSLHIIEIVPDRFRGAIKVIEAANAFSEKISLQHNGDFGANTGDLYYEWWIRDAAPLDVVAAEMLADGSLTEVDAQGNSLWQQYIPQERLALTDEDARHLGLHTIVFEGRPDVTLADKLVLMRYRHKDESGWNLVPFEITNPAAEWAPGSPAPFQWAGAANSPQLQADGSKRYIPQLVMGWVKRVLDRINPYEARYTDFFGNESPAVYSSQIQIAGAPFAGKVALNPDKNVIENTGLIELYETVLARARELSIDNSSNAVSTDGIGQALLLATTRLAVLYELLAREAYSDAQDSTITVTDASGLASVASFTHAFQNFEPDLLHEELALLRGTDFRKSYPVYNRTFWNYAKGLGEAAYNVNYNIYDENTDGFINEDDARALYPQGHGDSWGHFVSALGMHYELLRHPVFSWKTRSELYSLMQNVLEVDYLDEKTFAKLAAGKARAGRDIVRGTYRLNYTQDPDGQWQGYSDGADPARAWGVSEWATRAGQGAYFDWMVANAILPEEAAAATPVNNPENLDRIERLGAIDEIGEISGGLYEIQTAVDEANNGSNPLGFDSDAIAFDLDPTNLTVASVIQGQTHFEQIYNRALVAGNNAITTLDFASKIGNKLYRIADDTDTLIVEAFRQDLDYRNRLIEIFGRPYDGTIGFGKVYPEGYEGPDTQLFSYLDRTSITQIVPETAEDAPAELVTFKSLLPKATGLADNADMEALYADVYGNFFENLGAFIASPFGGTAGVGQEELREAFISLEGSRTYEDFSSTVVELQLPVRKKSPYAFQAQDDWGQRTSYGKVQRILEEELRERIVLEKALNEYIAFLQDFEVVTNRLASEIALIERRADIFFEMALLKELRKKLEVAKDAAIAVALIIEETVEDSAEGGSEALPTSIGFSTDVAAPARGGILLISVIAQTAAKTTSKTLEAVKKVAGFLTDRLLSDLEKDQERTKDVATLEGLIVELVSLSGNDVPFRDAIGISLQNLELKRQEYVTAQAEGFRLLREREGFNKILAAKVQKNRYQDMIFRLSRNEAMSKYQSSYEHAARYAWLTAKAYDYETSLDPGHPAAATQLLDQIVKTRQLGLWTGGQPQIGQGGLAEILASLKANFGVLETQLGINSLQVANENISMRSEKFRIGAPLAAGGTAESDQRWETLLKARKVDNLWDVPEFQRHCRPFANRADGDQPGIVIRFRTAIEPGLNFFGQPLAAGDHAYSSSSFATRVGTAGIYLDDYPDSGSMGLATTPRAYLVPIGNDYLRLSTGDESGVRTWSVHDTRIPTPFTLNTSNLTSPGFIPSMDGLDGAFGSPRRHADFRIYHGNVDLNGLNDNEQSTRLVGRSIWNSEWLLVIPGAGLHADPDFGLDQFAENVSDIKLTFKTYSHNGQ